MKASELRSKATTDLEGELISLLKEQFNLRMQKNATQAPQTHLFRKIRRDIARIKTILTEKQDSKEGS